MNDDSSSLSPDPEFVQTTDHYYYVKVRPKEWFTKFETSQNTVDEATEVAGDGCDVRGGELISGEWGTQSVLIPLSAAADGREAESLARAVVDRIEA